MRIGPPSSKLLAAICAVLLGGCAAQAETLTVTCNEGEAGSGGKMSLVYEGAESGTLKVQASFGDFELPASMQEGDNNADGQSLHLIGIRGSGPVTVLMPAKAEMENCVKDQAGGQELDADMVAYFLMGCGARAETPPAPTAVNVMLELVFMDEGGLLTLDRSYAEPSQLPGGKLTLTTWPIPECKVASRE